MLDNVNRLSTFSLVEAGKVLASACALSGSQSLLDACVPTSCPTVIGDAVMQHLDDQGLITDLTMQLFDSQRLRLTSLHITPAVSKVNGDELTQNGLHVLESQFLKKIVYSGQRLYDQSGGELLGGSDRVIRALNSWTVHNLIELEVPFNDLKNLTLIHHIARFSNLRFLSVASTLSTFDDKSLEICLSGMPHLEGLDISDTRVAIIEPLRSRKDSIKRLSIYATQALFSASTPDVLNCLCKLKHLDISLPADLPFTNDLSQFKLTPFLSKLPENCPDIEYLDISGNQRLTLERGRPALLACVTNLKSLKFIGAAIDGDVSHWLKALDSARAVKITGSSSLEAITESLHRYRMRPSYLHHSLVALYNFIGDMEEDVELSKFYLSCLTSVIEVCHLWAHDRLVQLSGTASVYALTRGSLATKLPRKLLCEVVKIATSVLEAFSQLQLIKNAVLLLCNDTILDCGADWLSCASAVLYRLRHIGVSNSFIAKMSVLIISVLASRLSAQEAATLMSSPDNWNTLLIPVISACQDGEGANLSESTALRYCLSALWNLTDENPENCGRFVSAGGLQTYCKLLKVYRENSERLRGQDDDMIEIREPEFVIDYEGKLLGLLNNVSEVPSLRLEMLKVPDFLTELIWRIHQHDTERHYFSGGIIANCLNQYKGDDLPGTSMTVEELGSKLSFCVSKWQIPTHEHVAYRSFRPFVPLLSDGSCSAVRHWALWALGLVATKNPERYASMLKRDGIFSMICDLLLLLANDELAQMLATRLANVLLRVDDGTLSQALGQIDIVSQ